MRRLLKEAAAPLPQPKARGNAAALQLEVPEFQPEGPAVTVKNPGTETVDAVLSFQLYNWEYGILNAASGAIALKPGESRVIRLAERGAFKGDSRVTESGSAPPWRRLLRRHPTPDRSEVVRETERKILTASPAGAAGDRTGFRQPSRSGFGRGLRRQHRRALRVVGGKFPENHGAGRQRL